AGPRLVGLFDEMSQRLYHRVAGNSNNAGKWVVEFQDDENGAGDRERASDQGESACRVSRRQQAKAQEDYYQPDDQRDQQRLRNRRNSLRLQQRSKLGELYHEVHRLCLKSTLRLIARCEMTNGHVNGIAHLLVG